MVPNHSSVSPGKDRTWSLITAVSYLVKVEHVIPNHSSVSLGKDRTRSLIAIVSHLGKAEDVVCYPEVMHTLLELKSDAQSGGGIGGQAGRK